MLYTTPTACPLLLVFCFSTEVGIEPLEGVTNKRQAHLRTLVLLGTLPSTSLLSPQVRGVIRLVNLVGREVGGIDGRGEARLEGGTDPAQAVKLDTPEEGVAFDLVGTATSKTIF